MVLNIKKTAEMIVDFRTTKKITHSPVTTKEEVEERVRIYESLGVTITEDQHRRYSRQTTTTPLPSENSTES